MSIVIRQLVLLTISAAISWWLFLELPSPEPVAAPPAPEPMPVLLSPVAQAAAPEAEPTEDADADAAAAAVAAAALAAAATAQELERREMEEEQQALEEQLAEEAPEPAPQATETAQPSLDLPEPAATPPPAELGDPDGEGELAAASESDDDSDAEQSEEPEDPAQDARASSSAAEEAMQDEALLAAARAEFSGEARPGFATVLLATPEEQLDLARFFNEQIVLVPKSALDEESRSTRYFRLTLDGAPKVESVAGKPPLEGYRQYRDLFDYEYARLPAPIRELRRSVLARNEVYVFGALIPAREWALVIHRRRQALKQSGREASDVRRFVLNYQPTPPRGFDLRVEEIVFADGTRFRPPTDTSKNQSP